MRQKILVQKYYKGKTIVDFRDHIKCKQLGILLKEMFICEFTKITNISAIFI